MLGHRCLVNIIITKWVWLTTKWVGLTMPLAGLMVELCDSMLFGVLQQTLSGSVCYETLVVLVGHFLRFLLT